MRRLLVLLIALMLLPAATAIAGGGSAVIRDCTDDGVLEGHYTQKQLRQALANLPTDVDEYTDCRNVIRRAAFAAGSGGKGGGGGDFGGFNGAGGSTTPPPSGTALSPADQKTIDKAIKDGAAPVRLQDEKGLGGALVRPSQVARRTGPGSTDVPTPILIAAILLALAAVGAAAPTLRRRVLPARGA